MENNYDVQDMIDKLEIKCSTYEKAENVINRVIEAFRIFGNQRQADILEINFNYLESLYMKDKKQLDILKGYLN